MFKYKVGTEIVAAVVGTVVALAIVASIYFGQ